MVRYITVGIDGSEAGRAAAAWGAEIAARRGVPLRLVYAWGIISAWEAPMDAPQHLRMTAEEKLTETGDAIAAAHPELEIRRESPPESPVPALLDRALDSDLLVLGARGLGTIAGFLLGSVSHAVVARAECPVLVVRADSAGPEGPAEVPGTARPICVGLKRPERPDEEVLEFAFAEAARAGLPLRVVHTRRSAGDGTESDGEETAGRLEAALTPWREKYPQVAVDAAPVAGGAAEGLLAEAAGARLLVLGRGGRRLGALAPRVGAVVHAALHHARCPVVIVPHE
ncbi:universal stress protein [Streptomyces calidiresistens]|uniref:Universal stress protein n=1 Tax=Streptomyces calidiresistens TaxID=1485586 RepID=A0A7W3T552_9ACTN|nr:universal stress protein [Streptomyces calidiresistens]MBB0231132.1 universal stress protein [Streptomyces calidiresistens]